MTFAEDNTAWPTMVGLSALLESVLTECDLPGVCVSVPVPGQQAVLDRCGACSDPKSCAGQAWTRLVTEFPSSQFPAPDASGNCSSPIAYVIELGIARCVPVGTSSNLSGYIPPSVQDMVAATRLQTADMSAMSRTIDRYMDTHDQEYALGAYQSLQVGGDCGGGVWQVTVWTA